MSGMVGQKDWYKQIFIHEMRNFDNEMSIFEDRNATPEVAGHKKKAFY